MKRRRRHVPIVQFQVVSGELIALDARGILWAGGRESIDGKTHVAWSKIGGLPDVYEDEGSDDRGDGVTYFPPGKSARRG